MNVAYEMGKALVKKASLGHEAAGYLGTSLIPFVGPIYGAANGVGELAGMLTDTQSKDEQTEESKSKWTNYIPGMSGYRLTKRLGRSVQDIDKGDYSKLVSESAGSLTSPLVAALLLGGLGAGVGGLAGGSSDSAAQGAALGGLGGLAAGALASPVRALTAYFGKGRSDADRENTSVFKNLVIPGEAMHNRMHRYKETAGEYDRAGRDEELAERRAKKIMDRVALANAKKLLAEG